MAEVFGDFGGWLRCSAGCAGRFMCDENQSSVPFFVAGAVLCQVAVPLFVARAILLGEVAGMLERNFLWQALFLLKLERSFWRQAQHWLKFWEITNVAFSIQNAPRWDE